MGDLSIIGRDFQMSEEPVGFVRRRRLRQGRGRDRGVVRRPVRADGRRGGVLVPGVGPVVVAGPLAAALLAGLEGAIAGTALGGLAGALVGWGIPKDRALTYETQIKGGKFLVVARGVPGAVERAREPARPPHVGACGCLQADVAVNPRSPGSIDRMAPRGAAAGPRLVPGR